MAREYRLQLWWPAPRDQWLGFELAAMGPMWRTRPRVPWVPARMRPTRLRIIRLG